MPQPASHTTPAHQQNGDFSARRKSLLCEEGRQSLRRSPVALLRRRRVGQNRRKNHRLENRRRLLYPAPLAHSYGASKSNPWSLFWIHISGTHVSQLIEAVNLNAPETPIHAAYSEHRTDLFNQIFQTFSKGLSISNLMYANLILPNYLATFISHRSFHDLTQKTAPENNLANQAILYMQQHIGKKVTV